MKILKIALMSMFLFSPLMGQGTFQPLSPISNASTEPTITLEETDQVLPAGLWRFKLSGDILTIDKNTAVAGDFSTLVSLFEMTATSLIIDVSSNEAFLVRKNADGGDVFAVDTSMSLVTVTGALRAGNVQFNENADGNIRLVTDAGALLFGASSDAQIHRDGPDILAQRRGNNGQAWYVYDEFTDLSNFSRIAMYAGGPPPKVFEIEVQTAGTGTDVIDLTLSSAGSTSFVRLENGDSQFISLESSQLQFFPNSVVSIGTIGGFRPLAGFFGGELQAGLNDTSASGAQMLTLDSPNLTSGPTQRDSHSIIVTGQGHTGASQSDGDWKQFADVKDNSANSTYTWQFRRNNNTFRNKVGFGFNSDPDTGLPGGLMSMDQATDASTNFKHRASFVTTNASPITLSNAIPAGRRVLGVTTRISATVSGGGVTGYQIGDGTDVDRWGSITGTAIGVTSDSTDFTADPEEFFLVDSDIVITFLGGTPSSGTIDIITHYMDLSPPQCDDGPCL